ncbi:MAG: anion permease [Alicyclobacillus macrosporangiidus]|uniref:SLC13 family permease n=1 Tax=Alicyclobacillus macrosporangiidus TaxID=392015 RepID=UPI0026F2171A|nr:SLC13 family permease [Alicyclobacillus macrosporangiidus]MCL6599561.1 anion permease [Alicyclobacillus macrosporangiidus]
MGLSGTGGSVQSSRSPDTRRWLWLAVGLAALLVFTLTPAPSGLKPEAWHTLGIFSCTVIWWVSEALPIPVTAALIFLLLALTGVMPLKSSIESGFGSPLVVFLLGALTLSVAFQTSGLSKRITRSILRLTGMRAWAVVGAFFWISFVISMFITDVAVVAMMLPPAIALLTSSRLEAGRSNIGKALMMAIMFGATEGGACTPAGVSANVATSGLLEKAAHIHIGFLHWVSLATPIYVVLGFVTWWLILRMFRPELASIVPDSSVGAGRMAGTGGPGDVSGREPGGRRVAAPAGVVAGGGVIDRGGTGQGDGPGLEGGGRWTRAEVSTAIVFGITVILWLFGGPVLNWDENTVALLSFGLLFLPGLGVFANWKNAEVRIEWGAILLIVAGVTLGAAAVQTGLTGWVAKNALAPLAVFPLHVQPFLMNLLVAIDSIPLSNLGASASINVPFVIAYAQNFHFPVLSLALSAGFSAASHYILVTESPSFVLPYAYGYFSFKDFAKIGVVVTLLGGVLISTGMALYGFPATA